MQIHPANDNLEIPATPLGAIVRGSLSEGLEMRLAEGRSIEDLRVGNFVVIQGERNRYFAMLTDVQLSATHPGFLLHPPLPTASLTRAVLSGTNTYGLIKLRPMLMLPHNAQGESTENLLPIKTVPSHFSPVHEATQEDVSQIFGSEENNRALYFEVGQPLDMDTPVCLNLDRWIERSNAIFGKSGTGKTFLTRLCLAGTLRAQKAVNLIFDMHSEYGWEGTEESASGKTKGLKQLFNSRVKIFSLDPESSQRRKVPIDFRVQIPYHQVEVEDILLLGRELSLNQTALETCYILMGEYREQWLATFLKMDMGEIKEFVEEHNVHIGSLTALQRKLNNLVQQCKSFLKSHVEPEDDAIKRILAELRNGYNVVLEFGQFDRPLQYMLVVNILTRLIHAHYRDAMEHAIGANTEKPKPLVITIEEAHKFLAPHLADQTIFGTIAREMRKYNVTLLIVDQRPSQIDNEILSQVGTKICCLLDDEKDVDAVLTGVSGAQSLRHVLASLETRQQALLFGHALPMPVVVRTRSYDQQFFSAMQPTESERPKRDRDLDFP
jgi:DNA helicase HerA-like ATPase